jgi:hypothetical protein
MTLFDRLRAQPRDKHPDPAVRLAFVQELPIDERVTIAAIAREDDDPRVRKAAISKLMAPEELAAIAAADRDEQVRGHAVSMLRDIALEAFEGVGESDSLQAVEHIVDSRTLAQIAKAATRENVGLQALARVVDTHMLGSAARHAVLDAVRIRALDTIIARAGQAELLAVAMNSDFKDTAVAAVNALADRADLDQIIARGKNKSAVKRARTIVREAEEHAAREAAENAARQAAAAIAAEPAVIEPVEELVSAPHGDPLSAQIEPQESGLEQEPIREIPADAVDTTDRVQSDGAGDGDVARRHARLAELVDLALGAAAEPELPAARKRFHTIRREWRSIAEGIAVPEELGAQFAAIDRQMAARTREAQDADMRARQQALSRLTHLLARIEPLPAASDLPLKVAERALREVRLTLSSMPSLPTRQDFESISARLKAVQAALAPRVVELREAEDWRRFANVSIQEQLCAQMEALKTAEDLEAAAREVRSLQQRWRSAADVPRAQADALWRRFKAAHDEVWARCQTFFAAQQAQRAENLAKKIALCEKVEALAGSTQWIQTAETIKALQAEWKTIGQVSRGSEKATWDRFRAACDRFFTRRHEDLAARKAMWAENLAKKDALCVRAEAAASSTEWDQAANEIRRLQAEWKTIGPVKKSKSEAIWLRFRGACDAFFVRYAQRHDTARAERVAAREAMCAQLEAIADAGDAPPDLAATVRALRERWQTEARGVDGDAARELDRRFGAALIAVARRFPGAFAGSELDIDGNRRRMEALVDRAEELAKSLAGPPDGAALSPTNRLAAMLKEALAANTIGGKVEEESRFRAAAEEMRQLQSSWSRIGVLPDEVRQPLAGRFQRAVRSISGRTRQEQREPVRPGVGGPPQLAGAKR